MAEVISNLVSKVKVPELVTEIFAYLKLQEIINVYEAFDSRLKVKPRLKQCVQQYFTAKMITPIFSAYAEMAKESEKKKSKLSRNVVNYNPDSQISVNQSASDKWKLDLVLDDWRNLYILSVRRERKDLTSLYELLAQPCYYGILRHYEKNGPYIDAQLSRNYERFWTSHHGLEILEKRIQAFVLELFHFELEFGTESESKALNISSVLPRHST